MVIRGVRIFFTAVWATVHDRAKAHSHPTLSTCHLPPCLRWPPHPSTTACAHTRRRLSRWPPHRVAVVSSKRLLTHLRTHETESRFFVKSGHVHRAHAGLRARARTPIPPPYPWLSACQARGRLTPYSTPSNTPTHSSTHETTQRHTHTRHHAPLSGKVFVEDGSRMRRLWSIRWM